MRPEWGSAETILMETHSPALSECPCCGSEAVVGVQLAIGGVTPVDFEFCTSCEWRSWDSGEGTLPLSSILSLAAVR
jgi:hypothetical protein